MVQDEVGEPADGRAPGTKAWGALTVFVRAAFDVRRVLRASAGAFHPPPEVSSAVVELVPLRPPRAVETRALPRPRAGRVRAREERRCATPGQAWRHDAAALERAAAQAGVSLDARGETLDVEAYARMEKALGDPSLSS